MLLVTYLFSFNPTTNFKTHATLFSPWAPSFHKAKLRRNWSLSRAWGGYTRLSVPTNKSSTCHAHTQCQPSCRGQGDSPTDGWETVPFSEGGV